MSKARKQNVYSQKDCIDKWNTKDVLLHILLFMSEMKMIIKISDEEILVIKELLHTITIH